MEYADSVVRLATLSPLLPVKLGSALHVDSLMASAMLSDMVRKGKLKVSNMKVGSSPLYYLPGYEKQLLNYTQYLNEKDRRTLELLQNRLILRDNICDPLTRVSLRSLKDFAKPLEVTINNNVEVFWKWFLLSEAEVEIKVNEILNPQSRVVPEQVKEVVKESVKDVIPEVPVKEVVEPVKEIVREHVVKEHKEVIKDVKPILQIKPREEQKALAPKEVKTKRLEGFACIANDFFAESGISIIEDILLKKGEHDCVIKMNSVVGEVTYYCSVREKKRITDADLSKIFVEAQLRKLPALLITNGELNAAAKAILEKIPVVVKQIGSKSA